MKKNLFILILSVLIFFQLPAQYTGSFVVQGNRHTYYPVAFYDGGWDSNAATELSLGRSQVHRDSAWRGSLIATFRYHTNNWGHTSYFIDANVTQFAHTAGEFVRLIAGWMDVTGQNDDKKILIWLKGGGTTYFYKSNYASNPQIYDGVQHPLPYQETNGPTHGVKTALDVSVNSKGLTHEHSAFFNGEGTSYFRGNVGIGTYTPQAKLAVNGDIYSKKVKVTQTGWPDYVFDKNYKLPSLAEVDKFINTNRHLPGVPAAATIEKDGLDLGDNQAVLLKKIEELTLYILQLNKRIEVLEKQPGAGDKK